MLRKFLIRLKELIWLLPAFYCLLFFMLALGVIALDTRFADTMGIVLPDLLLTDVALAQRVLSALATSLLSMTTITFSTIMVVLTTYASQYSPRILSNFIANRTTMRVLGVFLGGFVYSILALLFMRQEDLDEQVMSASVGVLVAFVCLSYFAYFIHHVATSIQVGNLIDTLTEDILMADLYYQGPREVEPFIQLSEKFPGIPEQYSERQEVAAGMYGYLQFMDYQNIYALAKQYDLILEVRQEAGQYLTPNMPLFNIHYKPDAERVDPDIFRKHLKTGEERATFQDAYFGIQKIAEVALRAIAPGTNNPNTAIDCIRHLGTALTEMLKYYGTYIQYGSKEAPTRVIAVKKKPGELLYWTFQQICEAGQDKVTVMLTVLEALCCIALDNNEAVRRDVQIFGEYVLERIDREKWKSADLAHLDERVQALTLAVKAQKTV
ncbi:DUF2254 domain-containing protein [Paenibacillus xerothermodurans]|uniref:DUF2254 domain-containing protein n=1 Tax=Paenibacillus xerothermodurans TaxID=1977292 RepID=A0A2W1NXF2_PAEXE|nr:DUF2254 domain-containing protein [Paenibacillus xerothermodurans]PZE20292.1 DUF2254 domain-containing protein [Paenibacillus xerothermodurans]